MDIVLFIVSSLFVKLNKATTICTFFTIKRPFYCAIFRQKIRNAAWLYVIPHVVILFLQQGSNVRSHQVVSLSVAEKIFKSYNTLIFSKLHCIVSPLQKQESHFINIMLVLELVQKKFVFCLPSPHWYSFCICKNR